MKTISIANELLESQKLAKKLFAEIEAQGIIRAGRTEGAVSDDILALGESLLGTKTHWHKRIVRAGRNATQPFNANPPELLITDDDLVYVDLGPVFGQYEADFGDTFQLGRCKDKARLVADLPVVFQKSRDFYRSNRDMTGCELHEYVLAVCNELGWKYGNNVAGHIIGRFSHGQECGRTPENYISPANSSPMSDPDRLGRERYWVLEVHLVDLDDRFGGFFEDLLSL